MISISISTNVGKTIMGVLPRAWGETQKSSPGSSPWFTKALDQLYSAGNFGGEGGLRVET